MIMNEFQRKNMSSSGKIQVPAEEYVIYYPPTDQSDSIITLNSSIKLLIKYFVYTHCLSNHTYILLATRRERLIIVVRTAANRPVLYSASIIGIFPSNIRTY